LVILDGGVGVKEEGVVEEEGVVKVVVEVDVVGGSGEERVVVMVVGLLEGGGAVRSGVGVSYIEEFVEVDFHLHGLCLYTIYQN
jgi:hypothetical protein